MKFIDINSVRGLEIDQPVFTKNEDGEYGYGKLISITKTKTGVEYCFEMAMFEPQIKQFFMNEKAVDEKKEIPYPKLDKPQQTNITHVCIPK